MPNNQNPLVNGIAVIIDDEIDDKNSNIYKLISQIKDTGMPCVELPELPAYEDKFIAQLQGVSFILLDWKLLPSTISEKDDIPSVDLPTDSFEDANIQFLKKICKELFVPVFIFTNEDVASIQTKLMAEELYYKDRSNFIFVKSKTDLEDGSLFEQIDAWVSENPPVYVLKNWEYEYRKAQNQLFVGFYKFNPLWVTILKKCFKDDGLDEFTVSVEIMSLIRDNIFAQMQMTGLKEGHLDNEGSLPDKEQIRGIFERSKFIENGKLPEDEVRCGDVFLMNDGRYYINIRPDCDCIPDRKDTESTLEAVELCLLNGSIFENEKKKYSKTHGCFSPQTTQEIIFCMYQNNSFVFNFKQFSIEKYGNVKTFRIGRLLPPFLTQLRTNYTQFLMRQGLPRIPAEAVSPE